MEDVASLGCELKELRRAAEESTQERERMKTVARRISISACLNFYLCLNLSIHLYPSLFRHRRYVGFARFGEVAFLT